MLLIMGTEVDQKQMLRHGNNHKHAKHDRDDEWIIMEGDHHQDTYNDKKNNKNIPSSPSSLEEDSSVSNGSSTSSSDLVDDASSSSTLTSTSTSTASSSSSNFSPPNSSNGPLFELSELMAELPIKRGLSRYYEGKSQSFTSLSRAVSIEDLAKRESPYRKKMKTCKSYGGGLDIKATISKKVSSSRASFSSSSSPSAARRSSFLGSSSTRPPLIPVQKHF